MQWESLSIYMVLHPWDGPGLRVVVWPWAIPSSCLTLTLFSSKLLALTSRSSALLSIHRSIHGTPICCPDTNSLGWKEKEDCNRHGERDKGMSSFWAAFPSPVLQGGKRMAPTCFEKGPKYWRESRKTWITLKLGGRRSPKTRWDTNISVGARVPPTCYAPWQHVSLIGIREKPRGLWRQWIDLA